MEQETYRTNPSLIERIKLECDAEGWERFFDVYSPLLLRFSHSLGLRDADADDLVQETVISVFKSINNYRYDPETCSFKNWLFMLVRRRLVDQQRAQYRRKAQNHESLTNESTDKQAIEMKDTSQFTPDQQLWESDWEAFVKERAFQLLKKKFKIEYLQVFDLSVNRDWSIAEISKFLDISKPRLYLILHRMRQTLNTERKVLLKGEL